MRCIFKEQVSEVKEVAMIKHCFVFEPGIDMVLFNRWYFRFHSKECVRFFGPWLRRYETYRAYNAPAEDFDAWHKAVVESPPRYTPPAWAREALFVEMASTFVPYKPDVDFLKDNPLIP